MMARPSKHAPHVCRDCKGPLPRALAPRCARCLKLAGQCARSAKRDAPKEIPRS